MEHSRRKRNVEFHKEDYERPRVWFYGCLVVCGMFMASSFVVKNLEIGWLTNKITQDITNAKWRN